ncbi:hypothetical protein BH11PSE5_BH11PSE5_15920 [soil metagenome]|uniref:DUF2141 domain-containing protein n=2 Tax=unclassified Sphingobium TaxID=2611147 RepID=UPI001E443A59|nr:DUF2141 domain-containing protein [Sphingobium sp. CECT 9361]GLI96523.1 hypothetical protein Sbs19_03410 [Sphingobium sp. BS19]CAH0353284.1 hypothetical protein SPH9361_02421 [Sphingobium sp. CECT 9361]
MLKVLSSIRFQTVKRPLVASLMALGIAATPATAQAIGPQAAACDRNGSAVLVHVEGIKARTGMLRVQLYEANPRTFLEKKKYLERVELPVPRSGPLSVCVAVPKPGSYALYVRHDANNNGKSDKSSDGGGFSGNPHVSLLDLAFKRKPDLDKAKFAVGSSTREIRVILNYVQGLSFKPLGA